MEPRWSVCGRRSARGHSGVAQWQLGMRWLCHAGLLRSRLAAWPENERHKQGGIRNERKRTRWNGKRRRTRPGPRWTRSRSHGRTPCGWRYRHMPVSEMRREGTTPTRRALRRAQMPEVWNFHDQAITNYPYRVGGYKNTKSRWNRAEG